MIEGANFQQSNQFELYRKDKLGIQITDRIYHQAYKYFKICNIVLSILGLAKMVATPYYLFINQFNHLSIFLIVLFLASILQFLSCIFTYAVTNNINFYYQAAQKTGHSKTTSNQPLIHTNFDQISNIYDFRFFSTEQDESGIKQLSIQIKHQLNLLNPSLSRLAYLEFNLDNIIHIWAIILLIFNQFEEKYDQTYIMNVLAIGTYQYFQVYLSSLITLIIGLHDMAKCIKSNLEKKLKKLKLKVSLQVLVFNQGVKGDHQCKICLQAYQLSQKIIVLKCSELHNFHEECLRQWMKNAFTCPLCRRDVASF